MAKSTIDNLVAKIKRRADYNVSNDTPLDTLAIDIINDALKVIKQLFLDHSLLDDISESTTLTPVADQEYIDISALPVDFSQPFKFTERTNDSVIELIPFSRYRDLFPDPSADSAATPDVCALWDNKLYLGPTPSVATADLIVLDYIKLLTDVISGGSSPFENKYDPLVIAMGVAELKEFLDDSNTTGISAAKVKVKELKDELIIGAAKNIGMNQQCQSRSPDISYFSPKIPIA